MKFLLIGPLPSPINGCSYANEVLLKNLLEKGVACNYVNTNTELISSNQGNKFSIKKAIIFLKTYFGIYKIFSSSVIYVTPGQTFFGVLKYAPFFIVCKILGKPYIIHLHGNYLGMEYAGLKGIKKKIFHFFISGAAAGIVLSKSLFHNFKELLPSEKIYVVENFVDEFLTNQPFQKQNDHLRILYLSNLMREKGILDLLEALVVLKNENKKFHATIAGAMEKETEPEFKRLLKLIGPEIEYVGTVTGNAKRKLLIEANVFILPTYYKMEGQPICLLEGMATGNIIITTAHAGIPDIINASNGFLVEKHSVKEIIACLEKIDTDLSSMINSYSEHNKKYAAACFSEKIFTNKIADILYATTKA